MKQPFGVGATVQISRTISESDVYLFAGITGDLGRNHLDEEYSRTQTRAGRRVVHGALLVGLASGASTAIEYAYDKGKWKGASYGYDRIRFTHPVFIGDTLTVEYTIVKVEEEALKSYADIKITNQHGNVCMVARHIGKGLPK